MRTSSLKPFLGTFRDTFFTREDASGVKSRPLFALATKHLRLLEDLEPVKEGRDRIWRCPWIRSEGRLVTWHETWITLYEEKMYFTFDDQSLFHIDLKRETFAGIELFDDEGKKDFGYEFVDWLFRSLAKEIRKFIQDPDEYNRRFARSLPTRYQLGKIQRRDTWIQKNEKYFLRDELTPEEIEHFKRAASKCNSPPPFQEITRDDFLGFCALGYDVIFPKERKLSALEKYKRHADGRHSGLLDLSGRDAHAMFRWMKNHEPGGHPWEIVRGSSTSNLSFYLHHEEEKVFQLTLSGATVPFAARAAKMAIALHRRGVPFVLGDRDYLLELVEGKDWIGIVPENVEPLGCHSLFEPYGEDIRSFLHLKDLEKDKELRNKIIWYPPRAWERRRAVSV